MYIRVKLIDGSFKRHYEPEDSKVYINAAVVDGALVISLSHPHAYNIATIAGYNAGEWLSFERVSTSND